MRLRRRAVLSSGADGRQVLTGVASLSKTTAVPGVLIHVPAAIVLTGVASLSKTVATAGSRIPDAYYEIEVNRSGWTAELFNTGMTLEYNHTGLLAGTQYEARVRANYGGIYSDWTAWVMAETDPA